MPSPHHKHHIAGGAALEAAIAGAMAALDLAGVEVPRQGRKVNVSALVRLALLVVPSVSASAWAEVEATLEPSGAGNKAHQLLTGGPALEHAIDGAHEARERAGRPRVTLGPLVRLALLLVPRVPHETLRRAAAGDHDETLRRLLHAPEDVEALRRAESALALHGVDRRELGRVLRIALLVAARAPDESLRDAIGVENALVETLADPRNNVRE